MKPRIICHMVSSIDGRLEPQRWTAPASGNKDDLLDLYEQVAEKLNADGWMIGRKTMAYYAKGCPQKITEPYAELRNTFVAHGRQGKKVAVVLDPSGKLHYQQDQVNGNHVISILGQQVPDHYLAELRSIGVSYLFAGQNGHDLDTAMESLGQDFGIRSILLEGGGLINGAFLKAKLIDEISLLVYPGIDGLSGIPSIFEYAGQPDEQPAQNLSLDLRSAQTLNSGMVWLHYSVEKKQG